MRLIDADKLCEGLVENHPVVIHTKSAPTIDAVEVVRCKDCEYWDGWCIGIPMNGDDAAYIETEENDYCSYGKRKENT